MHKSIIVLLGVLVVSLSIGTNNMNISNANAITENKYYTDRYMGYADDMVHYYEGESSYGNNDYGSEQDRPYGNNDYGSEQDRPYGNNDYGSEYQSYKSDYNKEDKSYGNHDYKSKDKDRDSNNVSISKINCNSVNYNVIGNVTGDNNIGNDGGEGAPNSNGALSASAYGSNGERYNDGYQKDKGVSCVITNNNTIITTGNATDGNGDGNGDQTDACQECFRDLPDVLLDDVESFLEMEDLTLEDLCEFLSDPNVPNLAKVEFLETLFVDIINADGTIVLECLDELGLIDFDPEGLSNSPTTTGSGLSNSPTAPFALP